MILATIILIISITGLLPFGVYVCAKYNKPYIHSKDIAIWTLIFAPLVSGIVLSILYLSGVLK